MIAALRKWNYLFWGWAYRTYFINDLPLRHRLDPLLRIGNCVKATLFPRKQYRIEDFRVAVTNICNAACVFCTYPLTKMKGKVMSLETFAQAMPYFGKQFQVDLTPAVGDPLVDPGLEQKVELLAESGYKCQFTTNGILMSKHADWLLKYGKTIVCVYLSVPSFDPADYKVQYGVDKGEQCINGLLDFLRRNDEAGQPLRIRYQVRNREKPSIYKRSPWFQKFKPYFHGRVTYHFSKVWDNWSGAVEFEKWSKYMKKRLRWCPQIAKPCRNLRFGLVNPDGGLRLCGCRVVGTDQDDLLVGKVGDPVDVLNANASAIREKFYRKEYPRVCKGCSFYNPE